MQANFNEFAGVGPTGKRFCGAIEMCMYIHNLHSISILAEINFENGRYCNFDMEYHVTWIQDWAQS